MTIPRLTPPDPFVPTPLPPLNPGDRVRFVARSGRGLSSMEEGTVAAQVEGGYLVIPDLADNGVWAREELIHIDGDSTPIALSTSGAMRLFCRKFEVPEDLQHYLNVPVCIERLLEDGDIFHTDQFGVYRAKE